MGMLTSVFGWISFSVPFVQFRVIFLRVVFLLSMVLSTYSIHAPRGSSRTMDKVNYSYDYTDMMDNLDGSSL